MSDGQQQCDSALDMSLSGLSLPESYVGDGGANPDVNGMYGVTGRLERTFDHPPLFNPNEIHRSGSVLTSNSTFDTSGFLSNFPTPRYDAQNEGMFGPTGVGSQSLQNLLNPFAQLFNQSGMDFGIPPISNMMPPGFSSQQQQNVNNRSVESFHSLDDFGGFGRVISGGMPSSGAMPFSVGWDGR